MDTLNELTALSHEFGTASYVKGGGGNTSVKLGTTLWIKPSGMTLGGLKNADFIPLDRPSVRSLFTLSLPDSAAAREELVKNTMANAVLKGYKGRPSVESPLHEILVGKYVVHTHPELVNGMTCSVRGKAACETLFPAAMWVPYIDPGYTLCMELYKRLEDYGRVHSRQPAVIFIENHGVFVSADSAENIRMLYQQVMGTLQAEYQKKGVTGFVAGPVSPMDPQSPECRMLKAVMGAEAEHVACSPWVQVAEGPLTPDHIVYSKSWPFMGKLDAPMLAEFKDVHGYFPKVLVTDDGVYGVGQSGRNASLALELALDGAAVRRYAEAFGGVQYMTGRATDFIENWEVESYRRTQVA
ncbi:MAG: class II aldolase/adducin family protein [bacterium]